MTLQLASYIGAGQIGNALVRRWTRAPESHCELVVDGRCMSSSVMDGGVRAKVIELKPEHWIVEPVLWAPADQVLAHFQDTEGQRYGWLDLVRSQLFNRAKDEDGAAFCSEWAAAALGLPSPTIYSPHTLRLLNAWANERWQESQEALFTPAWEIMLTSKELAEES